MLKGHDILCISSIDWDFIWQGHQEVMSRLAANGNRVLFVENTGVRPPTLRDLPRIRSRIRNWWRGTKGFREERPSLFVFSPIVLPLPYSRVAQWINSRVLLYALRRWMRAVDFHAPIVWTFLPTPLAHTLIQSLDPGLVIYYCIDDLSSSSHAARRIRRTEDQVLREADLVFVTSEKLRERASRVARHVHLFPFGVNFEAFERVRTAEDGVAREIQALPRPVVGYVGGLHQFVDQDLVCAVADAMPGSSIALVGPQQTDVSALRKRRNVHLLGPREHAELPAYIKGFDVGIVPYRLSDYTAHVYPTKLNEYLAMGIPVVASDLHEIRRFAASHEGVVSVAAGRESFVDAVRRAVGDRDGASAARRIAVSSANSWSNRLEAMSALIEQALGARPAAGEGWDVALRRMYQRGRRRTLGVVSAAVLAYVAIFHTPLVWMVANPLRVAAEPQPADAIVVFGGGVGEVAYDDSGYQERVKQAVDLYHAGFAPLIVFSSGYVSAFRETEIMQTLALSLGVPPSGIVLEMRAASTRDNVLFVRDILRQGGSQRILLVSSPYHMRRATLTWRELAPEIAVIPSPVPFSKFYQHGRGASLAQVRGIAFEYAALAYYWVNGWI